MNYYTDRILSKKNTCGFSGAVHNMESLMKGYHDPCL